MEKTLKYLSISYQSASLPIREKFHLEVKEIDYLLKTIQNVFADIHGMMILSTCNRMEIYFESVSTKSTEVLNYLFDFRKLINQTSYAPFFRQSDKTEPTTIHLLSVASGLDSAVKGDAQIISQIKQAYQQSRKHKLQGQNLERAMQAVSKLHKRISNETAFRSGSQSTAYQALKKIEEYYGKSELSQKKLLIVGMGEIGKEVIQYVDKFQLKEVFLSNRTEEKAHKIAEQYNLNVFPWKEVEANNIKDFDAIITGVSNRPGLLLSSIQAKQQIWINLAIPGNIARTHSSYSQKIIDLDELRTEMDQTSVTRENASYEVMQLVKAETQNFLNWYNESPKRNFLNTYQQLAKAFLYQKITMSLPSEFEIQELEKLAYSLSLKLVRKQVKLLM